MPIEIAQPKYVVMVNAIQQRIKDGVYPTGSAIPSEAVLMAEFEVSRPTAVRALGILQQDGWIDAEQGRGRFVRARSAFAARHASSQASTLIAQADTDASTLLKAGPVLVSARIAGVLEIDEGTPVLSRQRLVISETGPVELSTSYVPVELAVGAGIGDKTPIPEGLLRRLSQHSHADFDHAVEQISARHPSKEEAGLLKVDGKECLLTVLFTAYDRAGSPLLAVDVLIPVSRHDLEDAFPLT